MNSPIFPQINPMYRLSRLEWVSTCQSEKSKFLWGLKHERINRRQYRTRAEAQADLFDYIEHWRNPRQRRRLAFQQEGEKLLTQVSVETG